MAIPDENTSLFQDPSPRTHNPTMTQGVQAEGVHPPPPKLVSRS